MNPLSGAFILAALSLAAASSALAGGVAGKWKGQFDSAIGLQKYTYEFKVDGEKLTGKAIGERETGTNDVAIIEGKISKDDISFVEQLKFDDHDIRIEYTGKIAGDDIQFTRKVGDFGTEQFTAKRVKEADACADAKPGNPAGTNSPPIKP